MSFVLQAMSASGAEFAAERDDTSPSYLQAHGRMRETAPGHAIEQGLNMELWHAQEELADCFGTVGQRKARASAAYEQKPLNRSSSDFSVEGSSSSASPSRDALLPQPVRRLSSPEEGLERWGTQRGEIPQDGGSAASECSSAVVSTPASGPKDSTSQAEASSACRFEAGSPVCSRQRACSRQQKRLPASLLHPRAAVASRLLPAVQAESVALRMKSSIESLYDDSVAAIQSSQSGGHTDSDSEDGLSCSLASRRFTEEMHKDVGTFTCTSRTTTAGSGRVDERRTFTGPSEEVLLGIGCDRRYPNQPISHGVTYAASDQVLGVVASSKEAGGEAADTDTSTEESLASRQRRSDGVVFVVREDWEVFTLHYCAHTGVTRAVASALERVSTVDQPPDLCKRLPTVTLGGAGCQHCCRQLGFPCQGWWRSRYVLLRVTVTLADCASDGPESHDRSTCSWFSTADSWCGGFQEGTTDKATPDEATEDMHLPVGPLHLSVKSPAFSRASLVAGKESFAEGRSSPRGLASAQQQPNICTSVGLQERTSWWQARTSSSASGPGNDPEIGTPRVCGSPPPIALPLSCISRSTSVEAMEFSLEPVGIVAGGTDPALVVGDGSEAEGKQQSKPAKTEAAADTATRRWLAFARDDRDIRVGVSGVVQRASVGGVVQRAGIEQQIKDTTKPPECWRNASAFCHEDLPCTGALSERQSRLASLLSSPCDSFEGFGAGVWDGMPVGEDGIPIGGPALDAFDSVPFRCANVVEHSPPKELAGSGVTHAVPGQKRSSGEDIKTTNRRRHVSMGDKARGRGAARSGRAQAPSGKDPRQGAKCALEQCYSACARTIGTEAVAEAQNSFLGMSVEERELAAVFLDFVTLVAPGAMNSPACVSIRGRRRQKAVVSGPTRESGATASCRSGCKRKQVRTNIAVFACGRPATCWCSAYLMHSFVS